MDLKKYEKLKQKFENVEFSSRFKLINRYLINFSYFGHLGSILVGFYFIFTIFKNAIGPHLPSAMSGYTEAIAAVIFLILFEMVKRYVFREMTFEAIRKPLDEWKRGVWIQIAISLVVVSISFYFGISGAAMFSDQTDEIKEEVKTSVVAEADSIRKIQNKEIAALKLEIKGRQERIQKVNERIDDLNDRIIESTYAWQQAQLRQQLKQDQKLVEQYDVEIKDLRAEIDSTEKQFTAQIDRLEKKKTEDSLSEVSEAENNTLKFIFIVFFIESIILVGIYFHNLYDFLSYKEGKELMDNDEKYQLWIVFSELLRYVYQEGNLDTGDKSVSQSKVIELTKINGSNISKAQVDQLFQILIYLQILEPNSNYRVIQKPYKSALKEIKSYLDIDYV